MSSAIFIACAAVAYALLSVLTFGLGTERFHHGPEQHEPYLWVNAPAHIAPKDRLEGAMSGTGTVTLDAGIQSVSTRDGQAALSFTDKSIEPMQGESEVSVTIEPLDPSTVGPPPEGLVYASNAYRIDVSYARSMSPAKFATEACRASKQTMLCPTLALRYSSEAHNIYARDGDTWMKLEGAEPVKDTFRIFADTAGSGTFVAVGHHHPTSARPSRSLLARYAAPIAIAVAISGALLASIILRRRKSPPLGRRKS